MREATKTYQPDVALVSVEDEWITKAVIHHQGNMVEAARSLKISRAKLYRRFEKISSRAKELQQGAVNE